MVRPEHTRPRVRACVLALSVCVLAALCLPAGAGAAPTRLFSPSSVWNTAVPSKARLDTRSRQRVRALNAGVRRMIARTRLYPNLQAGTYSTPIYTVSAGTPRVPVTVDTGRWGNDFRSVAAAGVPIPANAQPAAGSDGHLTVYQPATDTLWEFWRARRALDGWHARWGGAMRTVSRNPGYYSSAAWPGLRTGQGWNWGSTASSLPVAAGTVTLAELRAGHIDHALAVALPDSCRDTFSWPAQRTDGGSSSPNCIPQGARLRLSPSVKLSKLHLPPVTRMLARAAQRYGMIVRDRTRRSVAFYLEAPASGQSSPYTGRAGLYRGVPSWKMLGRFPWRRLQVLGLTTCTSAPCAPPTH